MKERFSVTIYHHLPYPSDDGGDNAYFKARRWEGADCETLFEAFENVRCVHMQLVKSTKRNYEEALRQQELYEAAWPQIEGRFRRESESGGGR